MLSCRFKIAVSLLRVLNSRNVGILNPSKRRLNLLKLLDLVQFKRGLPVMILVFSLF